MSNIGNSIDGLLKKRGSPMAGLGNVFVATGKKYGVDPRLVVSISGIESGFGKHLYGGFNAWGWGPGRSFGSFEEGISAVTKGLRDGYYSRGLRTPEQIVKRYAPGSDGNDEGNWAKTVSQFMSQLGAATPLVSQRSPQAAAATPSAVPRASAIPNLNLRQAAFDSLAAIAAHGGHADPLSILRSVSQGAILDRAMADQMPQPLHADPKPHHSAGNQVFKASGEPVPARYLTSVGGEHATAGLAGFPARDYMAAAGSPAVSPVSGEVVRLSGHDPKDGPVSGVHGPFGWSVYIRGDDGHEYYLTHMGARAVKVGERVKGGQQIGTVGNYASFGGANHIHMGVR